MSDDLDATLAMHDELLARRGVGVWVGAEPTFTRADSNEAAWANTPEGDDKLARAHSLATHLANRLPGAAVSRVIGRQYPGEDHARFAFGVRWREGCFGTTPGPSALGGLGLGLDRGSRATGPSEARDPGPRVALDAVATPPPMNLGDDRWLTVTPDPGVVEVNMAPCPNARSFYTHSRDVWAAAAEAGLTPIRHRFNGDRIDSGGGGQITLGGARPDKSPFIRNPHVLPALIRYLNNHPSLSFWFASECVGSASQGPRPDEGTRERWDELAVALGWLEHLADRGELSPDQLWHALGPLLVDASGNSHRAELNVEKLWNPHIAIHGPRHGKMGVVELRAIRMPERPGMLVALVALFRSLIARLAVSDYREPLVDFHDDLHDRFALPAALHRDLRMVLGDLDEHRLPCPATPRARVVAAAGNHMPARRRDAHAAPRARVLAARWRRRFPGARARSLGRRLDAAVGDLARWCGS